MPNLPTVTAKKLIKVVCKKGYILQRVHGSHHIFVHKEKRIVISIPVHPGHDLGRGITLAILKDAQITIDEFKSLV